MLLGISGVQFQNTLGDCSRPTNTEDLLQFGGHTTHRMLADLLEELSSAELFIKREWTSVEEPKEPPALAGKYY